MKEKKENVKRLTTVFWMEPSVKECSTEDEDIS